MLGRLAIAQCLALLTALLSAGAPNAWAQDSTAASVRNELLVRLRPSTQAAAGATLRAAGAVTQHEISALGVVVVRTPPGRSEAVAERLRRSGHFEFVEPNYLAHIDSLPNDPLYAQQWGMAVVEAPAAWDATRGDGVTIAVVDSGVDASHPDLSGRVIAGFNAITDSADTTDDDGHGTNIAGIAAAVGFNALGVIGVAPAAHIMPVKVVNATGTATYADVAQGIVYATDHGAQVINLSLGGEMPSTTLSAAVTYAAGRGVVLVAAAGNLGTSSVTYPAAYPDVIAVGASDAQDGPASFSNHGAWLGLLAPGVSIMTTSRGGLYGELSGTSPAAPFVAGAAALLLAANPFLQPPQVTSILELTSKDVGAPGFDAYCGWGRLDVGRAVQQAIALSQTVDTRPPTVQVTAPEEGAAVVGAAGLSADARDDVSVARVEYSVDGAVVASATQPPFDAQWDTQLVTVGTHVLSATAYDPSGNRSLAPTITLQVANNEVTCGTPGGACLSGGGDPHTDCLAEWFIVGAAEPTQGTRKSSVVSCVDGSACDRDGAVDGVCTFAAGLCFATADPRLVDAAGAPTCGTDNLARFRLVTPSRDRRTDPFDVAQGGALLAAVATLASTPADGSCVAGAVGGFCRDDAECDAPAGAQNGTCALLGVSLAGAFGSGERCTALRALQVPLHRKKSSYKTANRKFKIVTTGAAGPRHLNAKDSDSIKLVCVPAQ